MGIGTFDSRKGDREESAWREEASRGALGVARYRASQKNGAEGDNETKNRLKQTSQ